MHWVKEHAKQRALETQCGIEKNHCMLFHVISCSLTLLQRLCNAPFDIAVMLEIILFIVEILEEKQSNVWGLLAGHVFMKIGSISCKP